MTEQELRAVEDLANSFVLQNSVVETHLMRPDEAIKKGALALFGEKYGDEVRVVSMGASPASNKADHAYSIELCGGTHVRRTGDIGLLKLVSESAVASGVRRIEALTGEGARAYLARQESLVREAASLLKVSPDEMIDRLAAILEERRKLERQLADAKRELVLIQNRVETSAATPGSQKPEDVVFRFVPGVSPNELRSLVDAYKTSQPNGVVTFVTSNNDKVSFAVGVTGNFTTVNSASNIAQQVSEVFGGKGGGRIDFAQGGGPHVDRVTDAERLFYSLVTRPEEPTKKSAENG
jgi:alanyl-tRNA synthetase